MPEAVELNGQCLCGAVTVRARSIGPILRACHCEMCRRHTSGVFVNITAEQESIVIDGPAATFQSSDWANRGFCAVCGSTLWYGTAHDGARNLAAGLFDNAGGATLAREYFVDCCPQGYGLRGDHQRLTRQETIALFAPTEGDAK